MPWTNKKLTIKWEHFVSKLEPGQKETWTAVITGPDAKKAVAEMVAALYDQSLDAYLPHAWMKAFNVFRQDWSQFGSARSSRIRPDRLTTVQVSGGWIRSPSISLTARSRPASP